MTIDTLLGVAVGVLSTLGIVEYTLRRSGRELEYTPPVSKPIVEETDEPPIQQAIPRRITPEMLDEDAEIREV